MTTENLHLTLSMPQIRKERAACAAILRALRPHPRQIQGAILTLGAHIAATKPKDKKRRTP